VVYAFRFNVALSLCVSEAMQRICKEYWALLPVALQYVVIR
jgi:hypothetical protein